MSSSKKPSKGFKWFIEIISFIGAVGIISAILADQFENHRYKQRNKPIIAINWALNSSENRCFINVYNTSEIYIDYCEISFELWDIEKKSIISPSFYLMPQGKDGDAVSWEVTGYLSILNINIDKMKKSIIPDIDIWIKYNSYTKNLKKFQKIIPRVNIIDSNSQKIKILNEILNFHDRNEKNVIYAFGLIVVPVSSFP